MKELTKAEEIVLLAIFRLKDNAYGVTIRDQIKDVTNKLYVYGTLYSTLEQLVSKGLLNKKFGDPTPERGGKRKVFFTLSKNGLMSLKKSLNFNKVLWNGISESEIIRTISHEE